MSKQIKVVVGSSNPCKIDAVKCSFQRAFAGSEIVISSCNANSGVCDQPMGDDETKLGALNRAKDAKRKNCDCDFAVGLEGGCYRECRNKELWVMAWMAIIGPASIDMSSDDVIEKEKETNDKIGYGKTAMFMLPKEISELVELGMELGDADDKVFRRFNSKHGGGTVGILTDGLIDRSLYYQHALLLALIPWMHPSLYMSP